MTRATETLTVVIPALNEEESIGSTIERCLDARDRIRRVGGVDDVEVMVVSDGSTDRTAEIAQSYAARDSSVSVVVFKENQGYGAALKEGFRRSTGTLVAFLDADGTCDPRMFADLCLALRTEQAAVAVGARMGPGTQMPLLRRMGNKMYALLLGSLSGQAVTDTASGMRVIRRESLTELYPLPDGMHFTPAMSARAVMNNLRITEVPMPYAERIGESKLNVVRDGVRFLRAISDAAFLYQPGRLFRFAALACVVAGVFWGLYPSEFYFRYGRLEEWMIYRLLLCGLLFTSAFGLLCAAVVSDEILSLVHHRRRFSFISQLLDSALRGSRAWLLAFVSWAASVGLVWPALTQYWESGHVTIHWSRPLASVFLVQVGLTAAIHSVMRMVVGLWKGQLAQRLEIQADKPSGPSTLQSDSANAMHDGLELMTHSGGR